MRINNQIFESKEPFGFTVGELIIDSSFEIELLIEAKLFESEIRPAFVKDSFVDNGDKQGYLKGLFCSDELSDSDFKRIPENGIYCYLEGFSESEEEWGDDKLMFKNLLESFKQKTKDTLGSCYLINKEWFSEGSKKVRSREFTLYDFYFIIIWIDKNDNSKVYLSEWFSD